MLKQLSKCIMVELFTQLPSRGTRCIFDLRACGVRFSDTASYRNIVRVEVLILTFACLGVYRYHLHQFHWYSTSNTYWNTISSNGWCYLSANIASMSSARCTVVCAYGLCTCLLISRQCISSLPRELSLPLLTLCRTLTLPGVSSHPQTN